MKVFSLEKFKKYFPTDWKYSYWAIECDGKPVINGQCGFYLIEDAWCEEKPDYKVIFRDNETILFKDGKRYVSKCGADDNYDREKGLLLCLAKANGVSYENLLKMIENAEIQEKKVDTKFKVGDFVKVIDNWLFHPQIKNGDIGKITRFVKNEYVLDFNGHTQYVNKDNAKKYIKKVDKDKVGVREVKRHAEVGEYIKIVKPICTFGEYKKNDIFKVKHKDWIVCGVIVENKHSSSVFDEEYVVLENYKPTKGGRNERRNKKSK